MRDYYTKPNSVYFVGQKDWDICEIDESDNILFTHNALFKVGITSQIEVRLKSLELILKDDLELLWFSPVIDVEVVERITLHILNKYRIYGEWFDFGRGSLRYEMVNKIVPEILYSGCMLSRYNTILHGGLNTRVSAVPPRR